MEEKLGDKLKEAMNVLEDNILAEIEQFCDEWGFYLDEVEVEYGTINMNINSPSGLVSEKGGIVQVKLSL